jgi:outer membrane protein assembly factor BamD
MQYAEDARKAYEKGLESFLDRDFEEARVMMAEVKRKYAYSRYARLAELRLADIDFEQEKFSSAITSYRAFVHDHRTDESVAYARFRICKGLYAQISDTILLPPLEERDQGAASDAYRELNSFLLDVPESKWRKEAQFMLVMVTGRLVRHELYVARYYLGHDNFEAAASRIQYSLRQYDGSGLEPEGMVLLAETYMKMKKRDEARQVLEQLLAVYPASAFTVPARRFLADLGVQVPAPTTHPPSQPPPGADPTAPAPAAPVLY